MCNILDPLTVESMFEYVVILYGITLLVVVTLTPIYVGLKWYYHILRGDE